ncbi:MAG: hypothetical protein QOK03_1222, partial [Candidatus Binataceae bacterium]|nr:hypothetical protein [Candidatus Binataceae bacterium]
MGNLMNKLIGFAMLLALSVMPTASVYAAESWTTQAVEVPPASLVAEASPADAATPAIEASIASETSPVAEASSIAEDSPVGEDSPIAVEETFTTEAVEISPAPAS